MLYNPRRLAAAALAEVLEPAPPVDYEAWAQDNISFSERESPEPGPFDPGKFPMFSEIYAALSPEDPCREVSFSKSAQVGGTIVASVFCLGSIDIDPCDFLYTHPTENNAKRWSRLKLAAMIRGSKQLRKVFPEKSRDSADSLLYKERADGRGSLQISGANSAASLSQVSMRRQVQDDLAKWENNTAGDPEGQADSRSRAFEFAKILKISTPLVEPGCRITRNFKAGSQEFYYVPCPHCGHEQILEWENFLANLDPDKPEAACFSCVSCGCLIKEHHRDEMVRRGHWTAHNPRAKRDHRSFHIWSAYSRLQSFERIAREYLAAKGKPDKEKVFYNDTVGRAYAVQGEAPPWEDVRKRAAEIGHRRGTIPASGLVVTLGVDVQDGWFAWQAIAWTRDGRRHVIDYRRMDGVISDPASYAKLDQLLASKWRHESGNEIGVDMLGIDGNAWTEEVWAWVKRHPTSKVIMLRGVEGDDKPLIARVKKERSRRTGKLLAYSRRFYNFASWIMKWSLYKNLPKRDILEFGYVGIPQGMDDDYFREMTAERRVEKQNKSGFLVYSWEKIEDQRNEALDTHLQAEAAAIKFGVRDMPPGSWDHLEAIRAAPVAGVQLDLEDIRPGGAVLPDTPPVAVAPMTPQTPIPAAEPDKTSANPTFVGGRRKRWLT